MTKVLVLYYSAYGHTERMAQAVAEGVRETGAQVVIKRVPELVPEDVAKKSGYKLDQPASLVAVPELAEYDAIIFGSGTRFGVVTSQMRNFLDQTGPLWASGALGSVFTGSATQHGGQESTILTMIPTLLHHGMIVVGLPYAFEGISRTDEITGGSPYGASTITKPDGSRMPSENELAGARFHTNRRLCRPPILFDSPQWDLDGR
jgi:NAD(P)H dehydrogenase (quinone)